LETHERFERHFTPEALTGCWLWTGAQCKGYGNYADADRKNHRAHRYAYMLYVGAIPSGLVLDHLCKNPACVNPAHLQPVTQKENLRRGRGPSAQYARMSHCKRGHKRTPESFYYRANGTRQCKACVRLYQNSRNK
jgi:hypothetical protein